MQSPFLFFFFFFSQRQRGGGGGGHKFTELACIQCCVRVTRGILRLLYTVFVIALTYVSSFDMMIPC